MSVSFIDYEIVTMLRNYLIIIGNLLIQIILKEYVKYLESFIPRDSFYFSTLF